MRVLNVDSLSNDIRILFERHLTLIESCGIDSHEFRVLEGNAKNYLMTSELFFKRKDEIKSKKFFEKAESSYRGMLIWIQHSLAKSNLENLLESFDQKIGSFSDKPLIQNQIIKQKEFVSTLLEVETTNGHYAELPFDVVEVIRYHKEHDILIESLFEDVYKKFSYQ